jgi:hypothetical protein
MIPINNEADQQTMKRYLLGIKICLGMQKEKGFVKTSTCNEEVPNPRRYIQMKIASKIPDPPPLTMFIITIRKIIRGTHKNQ